MKLILILFLYTYIKKIKLTFINKILHKKSFDFFVFIKKQAEYSI